MTWLAVEAFYVFFNAVPQQCRVAIMESRRKSCQSPQVVAAATRRGRGDLAEGIASSVMQTTRWVNGPGTSASPERGRQLWDAGCLQDAFCGRENHS